MSDATTATPAATLDRTAHAKLVKARGELAARMIERDDEIDLCLVALVAAEHCLFVGPPGTGKSMLCDGVAELVDGQRFSYLMTKFTTPEEVFGPISLAGLKADKYVRVVTNKLPEAEVSFLDEIFKSSSAILNSLLKILNERQYDAGNGPVAVPLRLCVAASNEWPTGEGQQELGALFDRFILRRTVSPIRSATGRKRLLWANRTPAPLTVRLTKDELNAARTAAAAMPWSADAVDAMESIIRDLNKEGIQPGDRRQFKAVGIVQASAWLEGAAEVRPEHLGILADCLWDDPTEQPAKAATVVATIANPVGLQINTLMVETEQILAAVDTKDLAKATAAAAKLAEIAKKMGKMKGNPKADKALVYIKERLGAIKRAAMDAVSPNDD